MHENVCEYLLDSLICSCWKIASYIFYIIEIIEIYSVVPLLSYFYCYKKRELALCKEGRKKDSFITCTLLGWSVCRIVFFIDLFENVVQVFSFKSNIKVIWNKQKCLNQSIEWKKKTLSVNDCWTINSKHNKTKNKNKTK